MPVTPAELGAVPTLGEHTDYVLHDVIGLEASEIEALRAKGIV
jgi:crotonobetainyl-CoA:carnitine CoA-transferase CaiB-like acyl-CoA transferase